MSRRSVAGLCCLLVALPSCAKSENKDEVKPAAQGEPVKPAGGEMPAAPAAAPAASKMAGLKCEGVLPSARTWFGSARLEEQNQPYGPTCTWIGDAASGEVASVTLMCNSRYDEAMIRQSREMQEKRGTLKDVAGLGKAAWETGPVLQAFDDDSDCVATVSASGPWKARQLDVARELLASVKQSDL
jgi:hypothetical protein